MTLSLLEKDNLDWGGSRDKSRYPLAEAVPKLGREEAFVSEIKEGCSFDGQDFDFLVLTFGALTCPGGQAQAIPGLVPPFLDKPRSDRSQDAVI
jgi:hypothetical protein